MAETFGSKALKFYKELRPAFELPEHVEPINIYKEPQVQQTLEKFFKKFFSDTNKRVLVLGINPGRFGSGVTGVPFTDTTMLRERCGIECGVDDRKELSSEFVYSFIEAFGGVEKFYSKFFLGAVSPLGFTKNGTNFNYYEDKDFLNTLNPFIISSLRQHKDFGASDTVILFGSGKNKEIFSEINEQTKLFRNIYALEHPRFIMQYQRKNKEMYLGKYKETFARALSD